MKATICSSLVLAAVAQAASTPAAEPEARGVFDDLSNAINQAFNTQQDGTTTTSNAATTSPETNIFEELDLFFSNIGDSFTNWMDSLGEQSAPAQQQWQTSYQQLQNAVSDPTNSNTRDVLCGLTDSLNQFFDSDLPQLGFTDAPADTVDTFDLHKHMGRWYQVYAGEFIASGGESQMACITHKYTKNDDGTFSVNDAWSRVDNPGVKYGERHGQGKEVYTGRMRLYYDGDVNCVSHGYYVLQTGPVVNDKYDWAIVSDPLALSVRILARDPERFNNEDAQRVLGEFSQTFEGFLRQFVPISQSGCPVWDDETAAVASSTSVTPMPTSVPPVDSSAEAAAVAAQQQDTNMSAEETDDDDSSNTGLWVGLGVGLGLLLLALLALLGCCYHRRRAAVKASPPPPKKLIEDDSNDKMIPDRKRCNYCQGPSCIYGGQIEHDIARKMEGETAEC